MTTGHSLVFSNNDNLCVSQQVVRISEITVTRKILYVNKISYHTRYTSFWKTWKCCIVLIAFQCFRLIMDKFIWLYLFIKSWYFPCCKFINLPYWINCEQTLLYYYCYFIFIWIFHNNKIISPQKQCLDHQRHWISNELPELNSRLT